MHFWRTTEPTQEAIDEHNLRVKHENIRKAWRELKAARDYVRKGDRLSAMGALCLAITYQDEAGLKDEEFQRSHAEIKIAAEKLSLCLRKEVSEGEDK